MPLVASMLRLTRQRLFDYFDFSIFSSGYQPTCYYFFVSYYYSETVFFFSFLNI